MPAYLAKGVRQLILTGIALSACFLASRLYADLVVITLNETQLEHISKSEIKQRWLGESNLVQQQRIEVIDIDENNKQRKIFYEQVVEIQDRKLKAYWAKQIFRGKGFPPISVRTQEAIKIWVAERPNRVGYIDRENLSVGFKILFATDSPQK